MRERGPPPEEGEQRQLDKPRIAPSLPPRWRRLTPLESSQWGCTRRPLTPWLRQRADSMPEEDATEMAANRRSWSDAIGHNRLASTTLPSRLPFLLLLFPSPPLPPSLPLPAQDGGTELLAGNTRAHAWERFSSRRWWARPVWNICYNETCRPISLGSRPTARPLPLVPATCQSYYSDIHVYPFYYRRHYLHYLIITKLPLDNALNKPH